MEAGIFKKLDSKKNSSLDDSLASDNDLRCYKCGRPADLIEYKTNILYCKKHAVDRAIEIPALLTKIEIEKKSVLEDFTVKIKGSRNKLEEIRSLLRHSEVSLQENCTLNLTKVNSVFKVIFEETKKIYTKYLNILADKANEYETIHNKSYGLLKEFEKGLKVIDSDISENYAQIVLNMDVDPFKNIITSYNDKVEFNIQGIEGVKNELLKVEPYNVNLNQQLNPCNNVVSGTLSQMIF